MLLFLRFCRCRTHCRHRLPNMRPTLWYNQPLHLDRYKQRQPLKQYDHFLDTSKVVADEDLLAGSIVDGLWRISTGGGNNSNGLMGNVTDWQRLFKYIGQDQLGTLLAPGYNWNNGGNGAFDINTVSDLTGLSIVPAGQIYSNGAFALGYLGQAFFFYGNAGQGYN